MNKAIVQAEGLCKAYLKGKVVALEDINLSIGEGEFISILGTSGSGKTTLLNIIGTLDSPTSGKVSVEGVDLSRVKNMNRFRAEKVGFVFQMNNLIPTLNAYQNVQLPMYTVKADSKKRRQRAMEMIEVVGLKDRLYHKPAMLSGGERQRVAIARALVNNPSLVLADEPTGTLDAGTGSEIIELMLELNKKNRTTLVIVTHDMEIARQADRVIQLNKGRIVEPG